jgi:hypothetical protein
VVVAGAAVRDLRGVIGTFVTSTSIRRGEMKDEDYFRLCHSCIALTYVSLRVNNLGMKIIFGYGTRGGIGLLLVYGRGVCAWGLLACLFGFSGAVSVG